MSFPSASVSFDRARVKASLVATSFMRHSFTLRVGHFDPDDRFAGDRGDDSQADGFHRQGQVVGKIHDPGHLGPGRRLELIHGHDRPRADLGDPAFDAETQQRLREDVGLGLELVVGDAGQDARWVPSTIRPHPAIGSRRRRPSCSRRAPLAQVRLPLPALVAPPPVAAYRHFSGDRLLRLR